MKTKKIILIAVAVVVVAGAGIWFFAGSPAKHKVTYATANVSKGDISNSVTATGTIEPVTEVEVGTQVSGIIDKIYVDYNSVVTKGQLIAEMDRATLQSELASQQATYDGAKAEYEYQKKNYERSKGLHEKSLISDTDFEQALYNYQKAKSSYDSSKASLAKAERNLAYATITSPIDGVVISRDVEAGQTVASGFETPTLFTIAADLTQMQVVADVDEADIGGVIEGQRASFTVDAYPNDEVEDRRGLTVLIRNALFHRVQLMDLDKPETLGALDKEWGYGVHEWEDALDDFYDEHEYVNTDAKARSAELFMLDEKHENDEHSWHVRQIIDDSDGDHDWAITGTIDLDATQSSGEVVFFDYAVTND